jgi:3-deoxy-manno-octulosonate cytidylyltransferase (CMP-KDO synthetase)
MKIVGMIPARLDSTRLPRKPLLDICGLPMIVHVYRRARIATRLDALYVVTDSHEIAEVVGNDGGNVIVTGAHETGTDRAAAAARDIECDAVITIFGDEVLVDPAHIDISASTLSADPSINVMMLVSECTRVGQSNCIKVVVDQNNGVLYLSRSDIPSTARARHATMLKGYHVVAIRKSALLRFAAWRPGYLERIEFIEHLRFLEHGEKIRAVAVRSDAISVDTEDDLAYVRSAMPRDELFMKYAGRVSGDALRVAP